MHIFVRHALLTICLMAGVASVHADQFAGFRFEARQSLPEMSDYLIKQFPLQTTRQVLRRVLVDQGHATLISHPQEVGVEKYIYDINLCNIYIWRWNVSANYDHHGQLAQLYLNGNPLHSAGVPKRVVPKKAEPGKKSAILKMQRPRPEAYKGETQLAYLLFDRDSDLKTLHDQVLVGAGPNRADPNNFGKVTAYTDVDPWRSIFDSDKANKINAFAGSCPAAK